MLTAGRSDLGDEGRFRFERNVLVLLVVDVVESVRLIEKDEEGAVSRWIDLVRAIEANVLPAFSGRLRQKLGDGLIVEFASALDAARAAFAIRSASEAGNIGRPAEEQIFLRTAIEITPVISASGDIYGHGINLAMRLLSVAGPNETVVSANACDQLTAGLDAEIEDLGDCYLKHVSRPVRVYRIGPPGPRPVLGLAIPPEDLAPALAVIPLRGLDTKAEHAVLGEIIAEELIAQFAQSPDLRVISRLSTTAVRGRNLTIDEISVCLKANYVLSGVFRVGGSGVTLDLELAEAERSSVIWSGRLDGPLSDLLEQQELISRIVGEVSTAITSRELRLARLQPLPTLKSYTLMLGAIALMHRLSTQDFDESRRMLQTLIDRASRQAVPYAWLAKWHVLRVQQGWSENPDQDAKLAAQATRKALETDPECSLALAIDGFVHTNLLKQLDVAEQRYDLALSTNPSNPLAWLLRGTMHAFRGEGARAVADTERALQLSPLDPHRWFFESLAATANLVGGDYSRALELAQRSLRANRTHTSTLRAMAIAQLWLGDREGARRTSEILMQLEPSLTVSGWRERHPSSPYHIGSAWAEALREIGVPR